MLSEIKSVKTACMFFSKGHSVDVKQDIFISGERLQVVLEYKYLGVHWTHVLVLKRILKKSMQKGKKLI